MKFLFENKTLLILLFSSIALIPISDYSLWIDESSTAFFASQTSIQDLNAALESSKSSEIQMPGYMYYMWSWVKIFGRNEFVLRLSNLPFMILLFLVLFTSALSTRLKMICGLVIVFNPFVWYNLNEARCTIPIFTLAGISLISLINYFKGTRQNKRWLAGIISISLLLGIAFNMLFILFIPAIALLILWQVVAYKVKFKQILYDFWPGFLLFFILFIPLLIYYFWTLDQGSGGFNETPSIMNLGFLIYEQLGFSGLGPPRNIIRDSLSVDTIKPYVPLLLLYALLYFLLAVCIYKKYRIRNLNSTHILNSYFVSYIFGLIVFALISYLFNFRFLGRHASFLLPLLLFFFAFVLNELLFSNRSKWSLVIVSLLIVLTLISDINIRFSSQHKKEDNRKAASIAMSLADKDGVIIWNGFDRLAAYYELDIYSDPTKMPEKWKINRKAIKPSLRVYGSDLKNYLDNYRSKGSIMVVFNRPEYDPKKYYTSYILKNQLQPIYQHRDFSIYSLE